MPVGETEIVQIYLVISAADKREVELVRALERDVVPM